jgi:glycosyltransferase involved in cell wall biosynthesis
VYPFQPSVSVCVPVYQGRRFLAETIRSVLAQTLTDLELVVLDNAGPDGSGALARSFGDPRIRVERNAVTVPQAENWNRAVALCRAPLVKLLRADDLLHPRCLELQVEPMDADPGLALVAARRHVIDEQSRMIVPRRGLTGLTGVRTSVEVARRVVRSGANPIGEPGGVLFRREQFVEAGGWRPDRTLVLALDLWMRLLRYGEFLGLPEALAAFRIGGGSVSARHDEAVHAAQRTLVDELGASPHFRVRRVDVATGRLLAPLGRLRRRALFALSRSGSRRGEGAGEVTA